MDPLPRRHLLTPLLLIAVGAIVLAACSTTATGAQEPGAQATPAVTGSEGGASQPSTGGGSQPGGGGGSTGSTGSPGADEPGTVPPAEPGGPDTPVTGVPGPAGEPTGDGALHVSPEPGILNPIPHTFDRVAVAADGRTLTVYYWGGVEDCYGLADARATRADDGSYRITVLEGTRPGMGDVACIEIALLKAVTITIDDPIFVPDETGANAE